MGVIEGVIRAKLSFSLNKLPIQLSAVVEYCAITKCFFFVEISHADPIPVSFSSI